MNKNEIIILVYNNPSILLFCKKIKPTEAEELKSELMMQLLSMSESKLIAAHKHDFLEYLCFKIIKRISYGTIKGTGVFYRKSLVVFNENEPSIFDNTDEDKVESELLNKIWELVEGEHWYEKTLFKNYHCDGLNYRQISEKYKINLKSIAYAVSKLRKKIKKTLTDERNNPTKHNTRGSTFSNGFHNNAI